MKNVLKVLAVLLAVALTACGGGGGGGTAGLTYDGVSTQATITSDNAADLASLAYFGSELTAPLPLSLSGSLDAPASPSPVLPALTHLIQDLPGKIDLGQLGNETSRAVMSIPSMKEQCEVSGSMTISGTYDMVTGAIDANISMSSCNTGDGVIMNGAIKINALGVSDLYNPTFTDFTVTFNRLAYEFVYDGDEIILDGTATSWYDDVKSAQIMQMNMVLQQVSTSLMAELENYTIEIADLGASQAVTISGRVYESDSGYFDITTEQPILVDAYGQPTEGIYKIVGSGGTWARVDFSLPGEVGSYGDGSGQLGTFAL